MSPGDTPTDARAGAGAALQAERIERAFSSQAAAFEDARFNGPLVVELEWLFDAVEVASTDLVLDVATGTGHAARALAARARTVVGIDTTRAMLEAGRAAAEHHGVRNVVFQQGDAMALPFLDSSFDVVVSRFAVHHFELPAAVAAEMARCLRPGGRLALADMIAADDPAVAAEQDRLERLRDPSHTRMLTAGELASLACDRGLAVVHTESRVRERPLEQWLAQADAPAPAAAEIRARLREELAGGAPTGLRPREAGGELFFSQAFATMIARCTGADR